jgi:hypothetical protein
MSFISLRNFEKRINNLSNPQQMMDKIGYKVIEIVRNQVDKQLDADGKKFPPYSERWQIVRAQKGLIPASKVDLTITGHMLRSMDIVKREKNSVKIGFNNTEATRSALGVLRNKKRPIEFMGVTPANKKVLNKFIEEQLSKG